MSNEKNVDKSELAKKPLWFLFLGANVLVLLACVITWIIIARSEEAAQTLRYLPTLICNLLSMVCAGIFIYFEVKDFAPQIMHFRRKWLNWYIAAFAVYVAAILFNVLFFLFYIGKENPATLNKEIWQLSIYLAITGVLTLISIGLQRYARFRIDLDVYRRKHGDNPNKPDDKTKDSSINQKNKKDDQKANVKKSTKSGASSGLLDQM